VNIGKLGEYEENATEKQKDTNIQDRIQPPLKIIQRDGKHQVLNSRGQQPQYNVSQWQNIILPLKPRQIKPSVKLNQTHQLSAKKQNEKYKGLVKQDRCADLKDHVTYDLLR
jgi:hypothetical protein